MMGLKKFLFVKNRQNNDLFWLLHKILVPKLNICVSQKMGMSTSFEEPKNESVRNEISNCETQADWQRLTEKLINREYFLKNIYVTKNNVNGVIMSLCLKWKLTKPGQSFYQYLENSGDEIHFSIKSKYLKLCSETHCADSSSKKEELLKLYENIRQKELLDVNSAEQCIIALSAFKEKWKEGLKLLEEVKKMEYPSSEVYSALITAAFKFDDHKAAWLLWDEVIKNRKQVFPSCYIAYLEHCTANGNLKTLPDKLETLFNFMELNELSFPSSDITDKLESVFNSLSKKCSIKQTTVDKYSGACLACKLKLKPAVIDNDEFLELKSWFFKKVLLGSNTYLKTNPDEVQRYETFLANAKPYNVVIDGLNISLKTKIKSRKVQAQKLCDVVQYFLDKSWSVLVFGRKHMETWPRTQMSFIYKNSQVFLTENISQDDPFLLFTALSGGPETYFISNDLMRSHLFSLEDVRLKKLFRHWLMSHQFKVNYITSFGKVDVLGPLPFLPCTQKSIKTEVHWHIPFEVSYIEVPPATYEPPKNWLCMKLK